MRYRGVVFLGQVVEESAQVLSLGAIQQVDQHIRVYYHRMGDFSGPDTFFSHTYIHLGGLRKTCLEYIGLAVQQRSIVPPQAGADNDVLRKQRRFCQ